MEKIESYNTMKDKHAKELNEFHGLFFAFNNKQLEDGLTKFNITKKDILSIGAGGFLLKTQEQAFDDLFKRHNQERKNRLKDQKMLLDALAYELRNHEYCITYDVADALDSLGLKREDIEPKILKKACALAI